MPQNDRVELAAGQGPLSIQDQTMMIQHMHPLGWLTGGPALRHSPTRRVCKLSDVLRVSLVLEVVIVAGPLMRMCRHTHSCIHACMAA